MASIYPQPLPDCQPLTEFQCYKTPQDPSILTDWRTHPRIGGRLAVEGLLHCFLKFGGMRCRKTDLDTKHKRVSALPPMTENANTTSSNGERTTGWEDCSAKRAATSNPTAVCGHNVYPVRACTRAIQAVMRLWSVVSALMSACSFVSSSAETVKEPRVSRSRMSAATRAVSPSEARYSRRSILYGTYKYTPYRRCT